MARHSLSGGDALERDRARLEGARIFQQPEVSGPYTIHGSLESGIKCANGIFIPAIAASPTGPGVSEAIRLDGASQSSNTSLACVCPGKSKAIRIFRATLRPYMRVWKRMNHVEERLKSTVCRIHRVGGPCPRLW